MKHHKRDNRYTKCTCRVVKAALLLLAATFIFTQCDNMEGDKGNKVRNLKIDSIQGIRIVYANIDTITYRYNFAIDINKELIGNEYNIKSLIKQRNKEIIRLKHKREEATTFLEYKQLTKLITAKEEELIEFREEQYKEFNRKAHDKDKELRDSITNFIKEYNKHKGYDYILTRIDDNMLYANESLDITDEIVTELNKRYNPEK